MPPWNNWYHSTAHTYGTWLRGDPRGWRARHHREHVDGDYRHPPPKGAHDRLHEYSKSLMKRAPIALDNDDVIEFVLRKMLERLIQFQIFCPIGCFDGVHAHLLLRCPKRNPKIIMGIAKQYATAQLKAHGKAQGLALGFGEGIWAKNSSVKPITDEGHYKNSYGYIHKHSRRGAVVMIRDPDTTQLLRMQPTS